MITLNGFSNIYWGWGGEDDDMSRRISYHGFRISRPPAKYARYTMLKHAKDTPNPDRFVYLPFDKLFIDCLFFIIIIFMLIMIIFVALVVHDHLITSFDYLEGIVNADLYIIANLYFTSM